ncbi:MAG TPA: DUF169 domain-containing protein [bacterium]|nr:DUF169 domain-containing protein [bacterium]
MDAKFKQQFSTLWAKYFPGAELPIIFYYTNDESWAAQAGEGVEDPCLICDLARVRGGKTLALDAKTTKCAGGRRYLGFDQKLRPDFEYFLSCGIPGKMEGERYKKTPELVLELLSKQPPFQAPGKYIVFKRWDTLEAKDDPAVVAFFASPAVLSGLFTLANFDSADVNSVIVPWGSGCSTIVYYPLLEAKSAHPKAVLGMFDVSARSCMDRSTLTFSIPARRFTEMVENMDKSFLTTRSWQEIKGQLKG